MSGVYGWRSEGSGENVSISTLNAVSIIVNRDFETASGDVFSNWTITSGAASTEIIQETTLAEVFRGLSALSLVGTGTDATIRQAVSNGLVATLLLAAKHILLFAKRNVFYKSVESYP